jgi:hypothetical protein
MTFSRKDRNASLEWRQISLRSAAIGYDRPHMWGTATQKKKERPQSDAAFLFRRQQLAQGGRNSNLWGSALLGRARLCRAVLRKQFRSVV